MKKAEPGLHIHNLVKGFFPDERVELFTAWAVRAAERSSMLLGFRGLPSVTHVWVRSIKSYSWGRAWLKDSIAEIYVRRDGYPANGGDGRMLDGIDYICHDWSEMLVSLVAHETAHLRGVPGLTKTKKDRSASGRGWVSAGRTGEQLCQIVAVQVMWQFREVRPGLELGLQKTEYVVK